MIHFIDKFPGKPKILFIGQVSSTHTHGWMNLLSDEELNIRLFAIPNDGLPPKNWGFQTYLNTPQIDKELDKSIFVNLSTDPETPQGSPKKILAGFFKRITQQGIYIDPLFYRPKRFLFVIFVLLVSLPYQIWQLLFHKKYTREFNKTCSAEKSLRKIIEEWQPDIIHTLGIFDQQGGEFFHRVTKEYSFHYKGKWVVQLRGGSDLALRHCDPQMKDTIRDILTKCDHIISDNIINIQIAEKLGIPREKFAHISPIPGSGGVDVEWIKSQEKNLPSARRAIIWQRAYDLPWAKGTSVLEALKICWDRIQPCEVYMLNTSEEITAWIYTLSEEMRMKFIDYKVVSRVEFIKLLTQSRVMLAPSLVDGIPNSLYEAMAAGAFPIVSPLDTIRTVVTEPQNVLFAHNLYPEEIAAALVRAMNDDELVDQAAEANLQLVKKLADKNFLKNRLIEFYGNISQPSRIHQ